MKKTIFHLTYVMHMGGTEKAVARLVKELKPYAKNIVVCMGKEGEVGKQIEHEGTTVIYLNGKHLYSLPRMVCEFKELVKRHKPDILTTYLPGADLFGRVIGKVLGIPMIVCNLRSTNKTYKRAILLDFLTTFLVDKYTVNSPTIIDYYRKLLPFNRKKFTYIPNWLDKAKFSHSVDKSHLKETLGIDSNKKVITYVSNFHATKGHRYLLEAFEVLFRTHPNSELLLVGDGVERKSLEKQIQSYNSKKNIHFLGRRKDISEILDMSDLFVMPTYLEGQSNALLEAMMSGCAIITTDIPENKVFLTHKESAFLVPVHQSQPLVEAMQRLLNHPKERETLRKNAQQVIDTQFDANKIIKQWRDLYTIC